MILDEFLKDGKIDSSLDEKFDNDWLKEHEFESVNDGEWLKELGWDSPKN